MNKQKQKVNKRLRRRGRVRAVISGTKDCPRMSVFRSNTSMNVQLIDDQSGNTLVSVHSREVKMKRSTKKKEGELSKGILIGHELGKLVAKKALDKKIKEAVFDRGGYKYHGRVKAVAEGAREGGLKF
jgi:large subunit ribosomal protein L18